MNWSSNLNFSVLKKFSNVTLPHSTMKFTKDVSGSFPTKYNASQVEADWWNWWESQGLFTHTRGTETRIFSMVMPPPNVTGNLHLGHALTTAIQDALVRWHRMKGERVIWVPGCDHAGIATQVVVEKKLLKERGLTRHQINTDEFLKMLGNWKNEKERIIYQQLQALGTSFDPNRKFFTLNENMCAAVTKAFTELHRAGLIYRAEKLVNWCCHLSSTISDIEVKHVVVEEGGLLSIPSEPQPVELGFIDTFAYPVCDSDEKVMVATTRIETMLGDVAVAVHPHDERYASLIGRFVVHPFTHERLPIIADEFVEREFETGAVKLTPAHSLVDFDVAKKHGLPLVDVIDDDGRIQVPIKPFQGLSRHRARNEIRDALARIGLYCGRKGRAVSVPTCSRSGDLLELRCKPQWFLNTNDMSKAACQAVDDGSLEIVPSFHVNSWKDFLLAHTQDWCISRQLLWGHRIPAYKITISGEESREIWISAECEESATRLAAKELTLDPGEFSVQQDKDVLDTWFSSSLIPLVVFGWPKQTESLAQFYPLSLMETGHDIMFFWVARMVMMCTYFTGQLPFKEILLHGMIRDSQGKKMSKSSGNVIDPMDVIRGISLQGMKEKLVANHRDGIVSASELSSALGGIQENFPKGIPQCGADGLRMALLLHDIKSVSIPLDVNYMSECHHLSNKIWQGVRFMLMTIEKHKASTHHFTKPVLDDRLTPTDRWILSRLAHTVKNCNEGFESYDFEMLTSSLRDFWVKNYCSVYLENVKCRSEDDISSICKILAFCTRSFLQLLSPIMPFLSEELYHRLKHLWSADSPTSITICSYPQMHEFQDMMDPRLDAVMENTLQIVNVMRSLKMDYDIVTLRPKGLIACKDNQRQELTDFVDVICTNAKLKSAHFVKTVEMSDEWLTASVPCVGVTVALQLQSGDSKVGRLIKRKEKVEVKLNKLKGKMEWKYFELRTPAELKEKYLHEKTTLEEELQHILQELK